MMATANLRDPFLDDERACLNTDICTRLGQAHHRGARESDFANSNQKQT